jgi:hypothetical protein
MLSARIPLLPIGFPDFRRLDLATVTQPLGGPTIPMLAVQFPYLRDILLSRRADEGQFNRA